MRIREARPDDAPRLARVDAETLPLAYRSLYPAEALAGVGGWETAQRGGDALAGLPARGGCAFVAEDEAGRVAAYACGYRTARAGAGRPGDSELALVVVAPPWQRRGLGRRLVREVAARVAARGGRSMIGEVEEENHAARAFVEALGGQLVPAGPVPAAAAAPARVAYRWADLAVLRLAAGETR
jgi:ribosomal protein S18 acetylase RimI-like enzyme